MAFKMDFEPRSCESASVYSCSATERRITAALFHFPIRALTSVADMNDPPKPVLQALAAPENTAGLQNAERSRQDLVWQFSSSFALSNGRCAHPA